MVTRDSWVGMDGDNRQQVQEASARNTNDADPAIYQLDSSAPSAPGSLGSHRSWRPNAVSSPFTSRGTLLNKLRGRAFKILDKYFFLVT